MARGSTEMGWLGMRRLLNIFCACMVLAPALQGQVPVVPEQEGWTLPRLISYAATNAADARIAFHRMRAARSVMDQASSALWPQLQLQGSYTRTDNPMTVFGGLLSQRAFSQSLDFNHVPDMDMLNLRGGVSYLLHSGGRTKAGRESAKARSEAVQAQAEQVRQSLAFEVVRTFYTVVKTRSFVEAAESAVKSFEGHLQVANGRLQSGNILRTEVLDMQVRLAQAREDLGRARSAYSLAQHGLRNLIGIGPGALHLVEVGSEPQVVTLPGSEGDSDTSRRAEWRVVRALKRAAEEEVNRAKAGYQPRVSAFGQLDSDSGWRTDGNGNSYTAGLLVQWDVWDGRLTQARVAEARALVDVAAEEEEKLRLAIELELTEARLRLENAKERLGVSEQAILHAEESVALSRLRFEQGLLLALQLMDAQTALTAARVRQAEARADYRIALGAVRKALGLSQVELNH